MSLFLETGNAIHERTPTAKWCHWCIHERGRSSDAIMGRIEATVNPWGGSPGPAGFSRSGLWRARPSSE